MKTTNNRLAPY